ncbi:hypothetical protein E4U17_002636 [Claviceps sp. LM77 group G4]|nr:hypothetical protein E4U17_002636 [Claviceps sp. LM77 group G4]
MMADIDEYLQVGFDPRNVTVPRLRSILVTHNIDYPSTAKKGELVELVNTHVLPHASKLRAQKLKAKRSSLGFVNAGSADDSNVWDEQETRSRQSSHRRSMSPRKSSARTIKPDPEEHATSSVRSPQKRTSRSVSRQLSHVDEDDNDDTIIDDRRASILRSPQKRASRSVSRQLSHVDEDDNDDTIIDDRRASSVRSPQKRTSRSVSRQLSHADDEPVGDGSSPASFRPTSRMSRRTVTPQIKSEPETEREDRPNYADYSRKHAVAQGKEEDDEGEYEDEYDEHDRSVFTDDNPFQGGSSSPAPLVTPSSRRRTLGTDFSKSARSVASHKDTFSNKPQKPRKSEIFAPKPRQKSPDLSLEPGEEFTIDEQLELESAQHRSRVAKAPRRNRKPVRRTTIWTPIFVLLMALLGTYGAWYRQEKLAVGYCGLGRPAKQLLPPEIAVPDMLIPFIEPQCEPCPQNAYCYEGFAVRCVSGFLLRPHPLSLGGLVPLPPSCEPDSEQERRVQAVADKVVEELRQRRAKYECGDLIDGTGHRKGSASILEPELKEAVSKKRNKRLSNEEFDALWEKAIGQVTTRDEVEVRVETTTEPAGSSPVTVRSLSSTSLARLPLTCAIKRSIWLGLARYRLAIGMLISLTLGTLYLRARYRRHVETSAQVPALVNLVLGRLADQRELGEEDLDDPWLFLPNLRDDVLRSIHSLSERDRIWQRVKAVVEQNSNVRTGQRESRNGEVGRAWEWIGPTKVDGARRRRSGRGPASWTAESPGPEMSEVKGTTESKKWEETRPIY